MNPPSRLNLPSLAQLALSGLAVLLTLPAAALLAVVGLGMQFSRMGSGAQAVMTLSLASMAFLVSILLIPSVMLAVFRLVDRPFTWRVPQPMRLATYLMILWPAFVILGYLAIRLESLTWLLLPPMQALAVGIPVWFFVELGRRGLERHSQQEWGTLSFGLVVNPILIIFIELLVLVVLALLGGLWASRQPGLMDQLRSLVEQLRSSGLNSEQALQILAPVLKKPAVIFGAVAILSVLMPMVEELFKPLLVWGLAAFGKLTPASGFTAGLISGGAFALIESLQNTSQITDASWPVVVVLRVGTILLHITTAGLMGRAIALALTESRYRQLSLTFLLAVALHGLWNFFALLVGAGSLVPFDQAFPSWLAPLISPIALAALVVMALVLLMVLLSVNRKLQPRPVPVDVPEADGEI